MKYVKSQREWSAARDDRVKTSPFLGDQAYDVMCTVEQARGIFFYGGKKHADLSFDRSYK